MFSLWTFIHIWLTVSIVVQWITVVEANSELETVSNDQSLDDCLHRYLEKDFGSFEASIGLTSSQSSMDISELTVRKECLNWESMLNCYNNVNDKKDEKLYEKLITGLSEMKTWICEGDIDQYKEFLGGIQCAVKLSNNRFCSQYTGRIDNKWQKLLRLELGSEICQQFVGEHQCFLETMSKYCNRRDVFGYNKSMTIVVQNWCNFGANNKPFKMTTLLFSCFVVSIALFYIVY